MIDTDEGLAKDEILSELKPRTTELYKPVGRTYAYESVSELDENL